LGHKYKEGINVTDMIANKKHRTLGRNHVAAVDSHPIEKMNGKPKHQPDESVWPPDH
jgi:hypothetical protein